ncbi:MAG: alpha/beta fold hydrolase [Deltaproteobacteria bacterium]|nr:MAG: alpha/beta fold hydrolase [Deltaproteobacteria bacterium]
MPTPLALTAPDGHPIGATLYRPSSPRAAVLLLGAFAVPQRFYRRFAEWLEGRGFAVLTYDYRGVGASLDGPVKGHPADATAWAHDAAVALEALREHVPGVPLLGVAHSFGGQILGVVDALHALDGVVTYGSQFGYVGHWPMPRRLGFRVLTYAALPGLSRAFGYMPGWAGLGTDVPGGAAREWAKWCRSPGYLMDHVPGARERFAAYEGELFVVRATDDTYAPEAAVDAYAAAFTNASVERLTLSPRALGLPSIGHFDMFRPTYAGTVWPELGQVLSSWADADARAA